jgi:hypothetical protein
MTVSQFPKKERTVEICYKDLPSCRIRDKEEDAPSISVPSPLLKGNLFEN